jgi:hypothetical protein
MDVAHCGHELGNSDTAPFGQHLKWFVPSALAQNGDQIREIDPVWVSHLRIPRELVRTGSQRSVVEVDVLRKTLQLCKSFSALETLPSLWE